MFKIGASDWVFQKQRWISREGVLGSSPGTGKEAGQRWDSTVVQPQSDPSGPSGW